MADKCIIDSTLYAIKHKGSGRFVTGTNFRYSPPRQILSDFNAPLVISGYDLMSELTHRQVSMRYYEVVKVTVEEVK